MTFEPNTSSSRWRRNLATALAGAGMAVALTLGSAPGLASADVLDDLANEFTTAAGGGQISTLLNQSMKLRAMGVRPTNGELTAIQDALKYRPNQTPLIKALKEAVEGQTHRYQQAQAANQKPGYTVGINQYDPNNPGGVSLGPGGIGIGGGTNQYQIGGQPGSVVGPPG